MSTPALIPYAGKPRTRPAFTRGKPEAFREPKPKGYNLHTISQVPQHLTVAQDRKALALFRDGRDTVAIASALKCTQAAAANGIARAKERERAGQ